MGYARKRESVGHVLSECSRHDKVADIMHWVLCQKYGLQCKHEYFGREHPVMDNDEGKEKNALLIGSAVP